MDTLTTLEDCSEGEIGGCRTVCTKELPPFSMLRWDSDSVRSDSPPSEDRKSLSPVPARRSRAPSGWYLDDRDNKVKPEICILQQFKAKLKIFISVS